MNDLRYSADWQDDAANVAPEERATVADLRLWLQQQNVTLHLHGSEIFDHLTIPLYPLAHGLTHDWWGLFGGRDREFSLMRHRNGYALPDIRCRFDGGVFEILAEQRIYQNPDIRFWVGPSEVMTRDDAETVLGGIIECILARLNDRGVHDTSAALRWRRIHASRTDPDEATFCESAGALGLDPYQIDDEAASTIEAAAAVFSGEPLIEFLAGTNGANRHPLLQWIQDVQRRPRYRSRIADLSDAAAQAARQAPRRADTEGWALGYRRARAMRHALDLTASTRFRSYGALAQKLGASKEYRVVERIDGIRALRTDSEDGVRIHLRNHGKSAEAQASHLFSLARAVGDVACFPEPTPAAPINELRAAYRQAAGRAFAAEFLAPIHEILSMRDDGRDVVSIAEEFSVSTTVIDHQMENTERIQTACA